MQSTARVSIDAAGRLIVPKAVRQEAGIKPGMELEIRFREGRVEIEPVPREVRIERRGKVLVAVPDEPSEPLTEATVRKTLEELRNR